MWDKWFIQCYYNFKKILKNNEFENFFKKFQKEINILEGILSKTDMEKLYNNMGLPNNYTDIRYL